MSDNFKNSVTIKQLRALQATIDSGSMIAAAEKLNVTPPAVSLQLSLLEEITNMPILERRNGVNELTPAGQHIIEAGKDIEAALRKAQGNINMLIGEDTGKVTLGITSMAKYFTPPLIHGFSQKNPDINISLNVDHRDEILDKLYHHDIDMVIMGESVPDSNFEYVEIGTHPQVLIGHNTHALHDKQDVSIKDFRNEKFIMRENGSSERDILDDFFKQLRFTPNNIMEINSNEMIKQSVIAAVGVALVSAHTMFNELKSGDLKIFNVKELPIERQWYALKRKSSLLQPSSQVLWDYIVENTKQYLPIM